MHRPAADRVQPVGADRRGHGEGLGEGEVVTETAGGLHDDAVTGRDVEDVEAAGGVVLRASGPSITKRCTA